MDKRLVLTSALVITAVITVLALTWGFRYDWPDYVHDGYGVPLTWGIHTLNTIQGPADVWRVDVMALFLDLALWMVIMVISQIILWMILEKRGA